MTSRLGENICKKCDQQEVNGQNIQTAHTTEKQTNNNNKKTTQSRKKGGAQKT